MSFDDNIKRALGIKSQKMPIVLQTKKMKGGTFIPSYHHKIAPTRIDDETWWVPDKSGKITKGYFKGDYYDAKRKVIIDIDTKKVISDVKKWNRRPR